MRRSLEVLRTVAALMTVVRWASADAGAGTPCPQGDADCQALGERCLDGYCCDRADCDTKACGRCDGQDQHWTGAVNGVCSPAPVGSDPRPGLGCGMRCNFGNTLNCASNACVTTTSCATGFYCNLSSNQCVTQLEVGTRCPVNCLTTGPCDNCLTTGPCDACMGGNCANGVCCNDACNRTCMACTAALTGAATDGHCGPVLEGMSDPGMTCPKDTPCGTTGACDGHGKCALYPDGHECVLDPDAQTGLRFTCDGRGQCVLHQIVDACIEDSSECHVECDGGCTDGGPASTDASSRSLCDGNACPNGDAESCGDACHDASLCGSGDAATCSAPTCAGKNTVLDGTTPRPCPAFHECVEGRGCVQHCGQSFCLEEQICLLNGECGPPGSEQPQPNASCSMTGRRPRAKEGADELDLIGIIGCALTVLVWRRRRVRSA
jgi:hypothetical protein